MAQQSSTSFNYPLLLVADPNPYPTYKWMRDEDPAHYSENEDLWVLTRFGDVRNAFRDWKTWSSQQRGNLINDQPERIGKTLGTTDPPAHTFARGLIDKAFTHRTIDGLTARISTVSQELVNQVRDRYSFEFVGDISAPFNAAILGAMFGVPESDFLELRHWLDDFLLCEKPDGEREPRQVVAMRKLREYTTELANEKSGKPGDDLLSAMIAAKDGDQKLAREQIVITTMTFLIAGFESTNNLFTNLVYALALNPDMLSELKSSPDSTSAFVEEGIRWDAPAQGFVRTPTRDVRLHGKVIPKGTQVMLHVGSANRDEREFDDPDRFDFHRPKQRHLGFGVGIHACVAAPLGRLMARILFEDLIAASTQWNIDLDQARRVATPNFRGFSTLPLKV